MGRTTGAPVETSILLIAAVVLAGVLIMGYGFFHYSDRTVYAGIFLGGAASWGLIWSVAFSQTSIRAGRRWSLRKSDRYQRRADQRRVHRAS
jgi:hypothetical protein